MNILIQKSETISYKMPPKRRQTRRRRAPVKRRALRRNRAPVKRRRGGKIKPSVILGSASTALTGASALGFDAPITLPLAGITGIGSAVAKLFGFGGLTSEQARILKRAQKGGMIVSARAPRRKRRR